MPRTATSDALDDLLNGFKAVRRATARVEFQVDPERPGRTGYIITGELREAVADAVDGRMRSVDTARGGVPGSARFTAISRNADGLFQSIGEVIIAQRHQATA